MTVAELREQLGSFPGHWLVTVESTSDGSGGGADTEYCLTLDVERGNFPTVGNMAVIRLGDRSKGGTS